MPTDVSYVARRLTSRGLRRIYLIRRSEAGAGLEEENQKGKVSGITNSILYPISLIEYIIPNITNLTIKSIKP